MLLDNIASLMLTAFTAAFTENMVFSHGIGTNTILAAAKSQKNFWGICLGVLYMSTVGSVAAWAMARVTDIGNIYPAYVPLCYVLTISIVYVLTLLLAMVILRERFSAMKKYIHISAFNAAVMGTMYLSVSECTTLSDFLFFGIGSGVGFCMAALMLFAVYERLFSKETPAAFRGVPAALIYFGIIAMAFYGIAGYSPSYL